mgnify:CR=1 FL=1
MKMSKKLISILLSVAMVVGVFATLPVASALETNETSQFSDENDDLVTSGKCGDNAEYALYEDGTLIISGTGEVKMVSGKGESYFDLDSILSEYVKKIIIKEGITGIYKDSFNDYEYLTDVQLPDSLIHLGNGCFGESSITTNDNGVYYVGKYITGSDGRYFDTYSIKEGTVSIADNVFGDQEEMTKITIPKSLKSVGNEFLEYCPSLSCIEVDNDSDYFKTVDGSLFSKDGKKLIRYAIGKENSEYTIPNGVEEIGDNAFMHCNNLNFITTPDTLKNINNSAFKNCQYLYEINIPNNVAKISDMAFENCNSLHAINIPSSTESIGTSVFFNCNRLSKITVDENNKYYESSDNVLYSKGKTVLIKYPETKEDTEFIIPNTVKEIVAAACYLCDFKNITIPDSVTKIGKLAFSGTNIESLIIPNSVVEIGSNAFDYCWDMKELTISNSLNCINHRVFASCENLTTVKLSNSVTKIEDSAFEECEDIKDVYFDGTKAQWDSIEIDSDDNLLKANIHILQEEPTTETQPTTINTIPSTTPTTTQPSTTPTTTQPTTTKPTVKKVVKVSLSKKSVVLVKGRSTTVKVKVSPTNATNKKLKWTTSNSKVAVVNSQGKITAKGRGNATIKVMALDGSNKYATVKVTVKQPVTSVKLNRNSAILKVKGKAKQKTVNLKATAYPKNANNKAVSWKSSNTRIATVNSKGKVTAKKKGTCYITATVKDGSKKSAKCKIVVK